LSNDLLAVAQTGSKRTEFSSVKVTKVVDLAVKRVKKLADDKKVEIHKDVLDAEVYADKEDVRQALDILLDNATKHGSAGGYIAIVGKTEGDKYLIEVSDKGEGIAAQDLPFIFDRLYRGDKARTRGGYGLGLSLAREIVLANNGTIEASNNEDNGATFAVTLPLHKS